MKKLSKLKLTSLSQQELSKKEQSVLKGGCIFCGCGCHYAGSQSDPNDSYYGGSSSGDNDSANDGGSWS